MMPPAIQALLSKKDDPLATEWASKCRRRIEMSEQYWSGRHEDWREQERLYRSFRTPDAEDKRTRRSATTEGVEKIVIPYGYAVLQSTLAFFMTALTQRKPIIPVEGLGPNDTRPAILHELLLDQQMNAMEPQGILVWYQWLLDALRYGVGVVKNVWSLREWPDMDRETTPIIDPFTGQAQGFQDNLIERDVVAYEGNEQMNVPPFSFFPDPSRPLNEFQRGEFVIHKMRKSWTECEQKAAQGLYAGLQWVEPGAGQDKGMGGDQSDLARIVKMGDQQSDYDDRDGSRSSVDLYEGWIFLKPQDWKIPEAMAADTPRLWVFTMIGRSRLVRFEPANLPGRRFPFEIIEPNYDCHSPVNFGQIETFRGMQYHLSWLFNSRMQSVRKTLNNQWVYDPSMVEEQDILGENQGQLIRLKRQHWQSGAVKEAVYPLPIQDVTQGHLSVDMPTVKGLAEEIHGASRLVMGMSNTGRRAATEVQASTQFSTGRMKLMLELIAAQGLRPLVGQMVRNNQTFLDGQVLPLREPYASMFGQPLMSITPAMLKGNFTFPFGEGGLPTEKQTEVAALKEFLQFGMQAGVPEIAQMMPWRALMARFLWQFGFKDLATWGLSLKDVSLQPDDVVARQVEAGNLVPGPSPQQAPVSVPSDGFAMPPNGSVPDGGANVLN